MVFTTRWCHGGRYPQTPTHGPSYELGRADGLPQAQLEEKNPRIAPQAHFFEAERPQGSIVGRLDARATGPMAASRTRERFDPGIEAIEGPYTMAAMDYFGGTLGISTDQRYEVLNRAVGSGRNRPSGANQRTCPGVWSGAPCCHPAAKFPC